MDIVTLSLNEWVLQVSKPPANGNKPVLIMLHGWTGDETSMKIFARRLRSHYVIISPRGIYSAPNGGYGWHIFQLGQFPQVNSYQPAILAILSLLDLLAENPYFAGIDLSRPSWVGFSQGAALAYMLALSHPQRVHALAGLAGFLPTGAASLVTGQPLIGKPIFITHGKQDEVIPIARARQAVQLLQEAGAQVKYCEDNSSHQVSLQCLKSMENFFEL